MLGHFVEAKFGLVVHFGHPETFHVLARARLLLSQHRAHLGEPPCLNRTACRLVARLEQSAV
jgi:hypothetical protein